jgi:hypothetical protein
VKEQKSAQPVVGGLHTAIELQGRSGMNVTLKEGLTHPCKSG